MHDSLIDLFLKRAKMTPSHLWRSLLIRGHPDRDGLQEGAAGRGGDSGPGPCWETGQ